MLARWIVERMLVQGHMRRTPAIAIALGLAVAGSVAAASPQSAPAIDPARALLPLDRIEPAVSIPKAGAATTRPEIPAAARNHFRSGQDRFDEQLWGEAINDLARALQIAPGFYDARVLLARAALLQGNTALARTHLDEALKARPDDAVVHQLLGDIAWQRHDTSAAMGHFRRALLCPNAEPNQPATIISHLFLGLALREEGYLAAASEELLSFLSAVERIESATANHPELKFVTALYRGQATIALGETNESLGRSKQAVETYRLGLKADPDDREMKARLARALAAAGEGEEAVALARELCQSNDASPASIDLLIDVCTRAGRAGDADAELLRTGRETRNTALLQRLAARLSERGRAKESTELLERLVELQPERLDAYLELAQSRLQQGNSRAFVTALAQAVARSKDAFERVDGTLSSAAEKAQTRASLIDAASALAAEPDDARAIRLVILGRLLALDGQTDEAARVLGQATDADATLGPAYAALAQIMIARGMWEAALDACRKAEEAGVREAGVYRLKGEAFCGLDENEKAMRAFQQAVKLNPKDARSLRSMATLYEADKQDEKVLATLRKIIETADPSNIEARESLARTLLAQQDLQRRAANLREARRQVATLRRMGAPENVVVRTEALLKLGTDETTDSNVRLERYRNTLDELTTRFPDDVDSAIDLAMSYVAVRDYEPALARVDKALGRTPGSVRARELRASLLAKLMRYPEAIAVLKGLLAERPRNSAWLTQLGVLAVDAGETALAAETFRKLINRRDLEQQRGTYYDTLIDGLAMAKDWDEAVRVSNEWLNPDSANEVLRRRHLSVLNAAGRAADGLALAEQWQAADPKSLFARRMVLSQLFALKRHDEASRVALEWLAARPDDADTRRILIYGLLEAGRTDEALELARTAADDTGHREAFQRILVEVCRRGRRYDEAIEIQKEIGRQASREENPFRLVHLYMNARRWNEAEQLCEQIMSPDVQRMNAGVPYDLGTVVQGYRTLATIHQYTGRRTACHAALEKVLNLIPVESLEYAGACNDLGYLWADSGINLDRAEKLTRLAAGESPRRAAYLDSLGWVLYKQGKNAEALKYLRLAVDRADSPDPVILEHYGDALFRSGDVKAAGERWKEALRAVEESQDVVTPEHDEVVERCREKLDTLSKGGRPSPQPTAAEQTTHPAEEP